MGFFFTILYIMVIMIRPQDFTEALQGWPLLDYMAVICLTAAFLDGSFEAGKFKRTPLNWMVLVFWAVVPLSLLAQYWFGGAYDYFFKFAKVVIVYILIIFTVDTFRRIKILIWIMMLLVGLLALQAVVMYFTGEGFLGGKALIEHGVFRAEGIGIFSDPNDLALNIVTWIPFMLPRFHKPFMSRSSFLGMVILIIAVVGIYYTRSRGGLLGLAAVMAFYFYRRVGIWLSVAPLVILVVVLLTLPRMGAIDTDKGSGRTRMEHWSAGMTMFKSNPVFGVGYLRFGEFHEYTAHNSFILVLAEMGFVGAFVWVSMFLCGFREIYLMRQLPRPPPALEGLLDGLMGALIGWQATAFFLSQSYKHLSFIVLGLVVSTMNALAKEGIEVKEPWSGKYIKWAFFITCGAVVFMYVTLRLLWRGG